MGTADLGEKFSIDEEGIAQKLYNVVTASQMSVAEANAAYRAFGFTPVYEETDVPADSGSVTVKTITGKRYEGAEAGLEEGEYRIVEHVQEEEIPISDAKTTLPNLQIKTNDGEMTRIDDPNLSTKKKKSKSTKPSHLIYNGGGAITSFSPPGGGGGSKKKKKKEDEIERYYKIKQTLESL
jgi:hypothetical protein